MAEHGGYRQPANPAPVSNPGRESARTDRGPRQMDVTGGSYGSAQEFRAQQSAAPLAPSAGAPGGAPAGGLDLSALVGLDAPSTMPDVPVTDGADEGPGATTAALGLPADPDREEARALGRWLPTMIRIADSDEATPSFRQFVHRVIQNL